MSENIGYYPSTEVICPTLILPLVSMNPESHLDAEVNIQSPYLEAH